jgi:hypothetical protein
MKYQKITLGIIALFFISPFFMPRFARAATQIYFSAPSGTPVGSVFPVKILVDADRIANAYAATIAWSGPIQFVNANDANSLITIWQKNPAVGEDALRGEGHLQIHFEGGALEPFGGASGQLLILNFKAMASGTARFSVIDASVYLADGRGTKITPDKKDATVAIAAAMASSTRTGSNTTSGVDAAQPEIKFLGIVNDPTANGQKLLSFLVGDAGSGVKASYVRYKTWLPWSTWQEVSNPAPLPGNAWAVGLRVEDNAGNMAELAVYDWPALWILMGEIAFAAFIIIAAGFVIRRRKKPHS